MPIESDVVYLVRSRTTGIPLLCLGCPFHVRPMLFTSYLRSEKITKEYAETLQEIIGIFYVNSNDLGIILITDNGDVIDLI